MSEMHKRLNSLNDIQKLQYIGYIWISDQSEPKLVNNEAFDFSVIKTNTFIIEANLFAENESIGVLIKHIDGNHFILEVDLSKAVDIPEYQFSDYEYIANPALNNTKKLKFKQYWNEEEDPLCEKLPVLKPAWRAFVGFGKEEQND